MSENEKYDDLDESIGRLKRAAIDAYVRDKIGGGAESFTRNHDGYRPAGARRRRRRNGI